MKVLINDVSSLTEEIQENIEWLQYTEGDEAECITIENLEGILSRHLELNIKLRLT